MDKPKVFIDGREGTTGLQLWERLSRRTDLELLRIGEARRKDPAERKKYLNAADLVFLCLPDAAAWEAVGLIENGHTRVIDASTAHRTASGWVYGFPELYKDPERIIGQARRVANPGCHATGFLASAAPLSALHILLRDCPLICFSLTGYSGGGRKMIAQYEAPDKPAELFSPRLYGTGLRHKHLTEMQKVAGLEQPPVFCPVVDDYGRPCHSGEDRRLIDRAKALLMDRHGITEEQAHYYLQKKSMDSRTKLAQTARLVLDSKTME